MVDKYFGVDDHIDINILCFESRTHHSSLSVGSGIHVYGAPWPPGPANGYKIGHIYFQVRPYGRIHRFFIYILVFWEKPCSQGFPNGRVTLQTRRDSWTLPYMCFRSATPLYIAYRWDPGCYAHMHHDLSDPPVLSIIFHICFRSGAISRITIRLDPKLI